MEITRALVIAHPLAEPIELDRFPYDQAGKDHDDERDNQREIRSALRRVVDREVLVREPAAQRLTDIVQHGARRDRQQLAAEMAGENSVGEIDEPIQREEPHAGEVPLQRAGKPAAQRDLRREFEAEERRGVVDLPTAPDHDEHGEHVQPMGDAYGERMNHDRLHGPLHWRVGRAKTGDLTPGAKWWRRLCPPARYPD